MTQLSSTDRYRVPDAADMSSIMSDEVKPKKHRRRQRSRKKKAAATIESMIPGRAPMGVESLLHHVESRKPTLPGAWPEESPEEQNMPPSSSPPQLQSPISTPSKRDRSTRSPLSTLSNLAELDTFDSSSLSQSPLPARTPSSSRVPVSHTGSFQEGSRTLSNHLFSPTVPIKARRSLSTMTTQRLSLKSPSTPTRTSSFAVQDESHELDSFEHLASSQPISLSQLCSRASSRLRTGKSSKRSHMESLDDDDTKGTSSITDLGDASETKSFSRLSKIHQANSKECRLDRYKEDVLMPSRFYSEMQSEAFEPSNEQDSDTWYNRGDTHPHRNPLSYSCGYDSPFTYSASGPYDAVSGSPFTNNTNSHNEFGTWPGARSYQKLLSASPANSRLNDILAKSSLSIYRESFDRPANQYPYESLHAQRSSHKHPDIRDVAANMQALSAEPHVERRMTRMTYLSSRYDVLREQSSDLGIMYAGDQPSTPGSSPVTTSDQKHPHGKHSARCSKQTESPIPEEIRRRSVKDEVTAFLRAIVLNSHPNASQMEVQSLTQETKTSLSEHSSAESITEEMDSRGRYAGTDNEVKHTPSSASWDSPENEDHTPASVLKEARISFSQHGYLYEEIMEKMAKKAHESKLSKTVRPPPGIPDPVVQTTPMGPSYLGRNLIQVQERIDDANSWFSSDNRDNQQLRQQVADIAENYAQRIDRFNGNGAFPDSAAAKQMTLLLGNVVINLHSYCSPDSHDLTKQDGCFANFGRMKSRYCEPNLGGRRSYFDQDPSTNQWRLSPERMPSNEDRPVSIGAFKEGEGA